MNSVPVLVHYVIPCPSRFSLGSVIKNPCSKNNGCNHTINRYLIKVLMKAVLLLENQIALFIRYNQAGCCEEIYEGIIFISRR